VLVDDGADDFAVGAGAGTGASGWDDARCLERNSVDKQEVVRMRAHSLGCGQRETAL